MMLSRRDFVRLGLGGAAASMLGGLAGSSLAGGDEYRALVVIFLEGGNDGHNVIVPTDGMYTDYVAARQNLALSRDSLARLPGTSVGHSFGLHPGLRPLVPMYSEGRLAFISNVGPLVVPATAAQVLDSAVEVPQFLLSHSDQTFMVQGMVGLDDGSGWAGRALEVLPSSLRTRLAASLISGQGTLITGRQSGISTLNLGGASWWVIADLLKPNDSGGIQALKRMARWQFANSYQAEYARAFGSAFEDSIFLSEARQRAVAPAGDFGATGDYGIDTLRSLASVMPYFKAQGLKRQVVLMHWGSLDTHANQRGSAPDTQDAQLAVLGQGLRGFDDSIRASGLDNNVVTLVMTEFGRTVRPGSGGGSEHGWGNHWWAFGGPVAGGTVIGRFPSPVLGGQDDGDPGRNGRHVPTISADQVGASLMAWMGLQSSQFHEVFPWLVNFRDKTIPLLRA